MRIKSLLITALILLTCSSLYARELSLDEVMRGACRITAKGINIFGQQSTMLGSGMVVIEEKKSYLILTNGHVATNRGSTVFVEFYVNGRLIKPVEVPVIWRFYKSGTSKDMAILRIKKSAFSKYKPTVIPLAPQNTKISVGDVIYGAGFPSGLWLQAWRARIVKVNKNTYNINMPPVSGQSGSGVLTTILDKNGEKKTVYIGIITWRFGNKNDPSQDKYGGAINIHRIYDLWDGKAEDDRIVKHVVSHNYDKKCDKCKNRLGDHWVVTDGINHQKDIYCYSFKKLSGNLYFKTLESCFPFFNKPKPNPPSELPPTEGPGPGPGISPQPDELKALEERLAKLQSKFDTLQGRLNSIKGENDGLIGEKNRLNNELGKLQKAKDGLSSSISTLKTTNVSLSGEKSALSDRVKNLLNKVNTPFGQLGVVLALIISAITGGTLTTTIWHKWFHPMLIGRFGWFPTKIIEHIVKKRLGRRLLDEKVEKLLGKRFNKVETPTEEVYNNIGAAPQMASVVTTKKKVTNDEDMGINISNDTNISFNAPTVSQHIIDFFGNNNDTINGIPATEWAIKTGLYEEAVDKLSRGEFNIDTGSKLQGQKKTAEEIQAWVADKYYNKITLQTLDEKPSLYHRAYIGFLYWQAIEKLKLGEFPLLGHEETAKVIDRWVKNEFLKVK